MPSGVYDRTKRHTPPSKASLVRAVMAEMNPSELASMPLLIERLTEAGIMPIAKTRLYEIRRKFLRNLDGAPKLSRKRRAKAVHNRNGAANGVAVRIMLKAVRRVGSFDEARAALSLIERVQL